MKKVLFFAAAALTMLAACNKTEVVYDNDPQEIAFVSVSDVATKTPVSGNVFSNKDNMAIAAYIVEGSQTAGNFFAYTLFSKEEGATYWTGNPARFWPLTASTINFLAVTENGGNVADRTEVNFDGTNYASAATVVLKNNDTFNQTDLMFAAAQGKCAPNNYSDVDMIFKHALAWINFQVATSTTGATITVNSITLNNATYNGSLALTNNKYAETGSEVSTNDVAAVWTPGEAKTALKVPNTDGSNAATAVTLDGNAKLFGNGLLVVPDAGAGSFTINYTLEQKDGTKNTYDYTHNLDGDENWQMAKKYYYNINITLTEIQINPYVTIWDESHSNVNTSVPLV